MTVLRVILAVLLLNANWSGEERLPLWGKDPVVRYRSVDVGAARVGVLTYLGGVQLLSRDRGFGGFSAMVADRDRLTMLSDGGLVFSARVTPDLRPHDPTFAVLLDGPGTGWRKLDRDSESLVRDPTTGRLWVGFEHHNQIWRYAPGFARAEAHAAPAAMRRWPKSSGAEAMIRLRDGRFLVFSEDRDAPGGGKQALIFAGDPTAAGARPARFVFVPPPHYRPVDAAELPDGRLLILTRRFQLPYNFTNKLVIVPRDAVRARARITGQEIATLAAPLIHDNFEGVAVAREGSATVIWLVSDDNQSALQRTLLLKFRLND